MKSKTKAKLMLMKLDPPPIETGSNVEHEIGNENTIDLNEIGAPIGKGSNVEHEIGNDSTIDVNEIGPPPTPPPD
jgi:hypothetical protein